MSWSNVEKGIINRQVLVDYLLGKLPEAQHQGLAERYFVEDDLFDQLLEVENDLIDQYVRGQLAAADHKKIESYLRLLPDAKHRIGVAAALMRLTAEEVPSQASKEATRWWHSTFALTQKPRWALQYALVTCLIALGLGVISLIVYSLRVNREKEQLRAQVDQVAAEQKTLRQKAQVLQQQAENQQSRIGQLQSDLQNAQQRSEAYAKEIASLRSLASTLVSVELTPASRSSSMPDAVVVTPSAKYVSLTVPLAGHEKYTGYRAILQTTEGKRIWERQKRSATPPRILRTIAFRMTASQLSAGNYKLTLILNPESGAEIPLDYYFTVVKP